MIRLAIGAVLAISILAGCTQTDDAASASTTNTVASPAPDASPTAIPPVRVQALKLDTPAPIFLAPVKIANRNQVIAPTVPNVNTHPNSTPAASPLPALLGIGSGDQRYALVDDQRNPILTIGSTIAGTTVTSINDRAVELKDGRTLTVSWQSIAQGIVGTPAVVPDIAPDILRANPAATGGATTPAIGTTLQSHPIALPGQGQQVPVPIATPQQNPAAQGSIVRSSLPGLP